MIIGNEGGRGQQGKRGHVLESVHWVSRNALSFYTNTHVQWACN